MKRGILLTSVAATGLVAVLACAGSDDAPPPEPSQPDSAYWVKRSDAQLDAALTRTCQAAVADDKPVLLAFSAPWCGDCRRVRAFEHQAPLKDELERWEKLVIDVGRLDRHQALLEHFEVGAIANWVALKPTDCSQPVTEWPVLDSSVFEPVTGILSERTGEGIAGWLRQARGG